MSLDNMVEYEAVGSQLSINTEKNKRKISHHNSIECFTSHSLSSESLTIDQIRKKLKNAQIIEECEKHDRKKDVICLTDSKVICSHCAIFEEHKGHSFQSMSEAKYKITSFLEEKMKAEKFYKEEYHQTVKSEKQQSLKILLEAKKESIKKVKRAYLKVYEELTKNQNEHYKVINKEFEDKEKELLDEYKILKQKKLPQVIIPKIESIPQFYSVHILNKKQGQFEIEKENINKKLIQIKNKAKVRDDFIKIDLSQSKIVNFIKSSIKITPQSQFAQLNQLKSLLSYKKNSDSKKSLGELRQLTVEKNNTDSRISINSTVCLKHSNYQNKLKNITNQLPNQNYKTVQTIVDSFLNDKTKDILDLSSLKITNIEAIISEARKKREIPRIKLNRNSINDDQFLKIIQYLDSTQSINLSCNCLTEKSLNYLLKNLPASHKLKVINFSRNAELNQGKRQVKDKILELKSKMGIVVMI